MSEEKKTDLDVFRGQLAGKDIQLQLLNYLGRDEDRLRRMQSAIITSVQKVPELLKCDRHSMMQAVIACAEYGLYPSAVSGEAFILPYKGKAQFQLGYQGLITLMYAAGVDAVNTQIVYATDRFTYEEGLNPRLEHTPTPFGEEKGVAIGVYAIASVNGEKIYKVMSEAEVMEYKKLSQGAKSEYSPWNKNDPQLWMWRKTCLKQLAKILPKNERLINAIGRDNEDSVIHQQIENRRVVDAKALKEGAPTMGALAASAHDDDKDQKKGKGEKAGGLFDGVAGSHPRE